jgi:hypothetical protein
MQYDPSFYIVFKGQTELGPDVEAVAIPHLFNLDRLSWRHGPQHPSAILNSGGWTTWDDSRHVMWGHSGDDGGGNAFIGFFPDGENADGTVGRWSEHFPSKLPGSLITTPCRSILRGTSSSCQCMHRQFMRSSSLQHATSSG